MALRISIVVHEPGSREAKDRFGAKLMEAIAEFDSSVELSVEEGHGDDAAFDDRSRAAVLFLQNIFGMDAEEARATYNQLEDKRIAKAMAVRENHCPECGDGHFRDGDIKCGVCGARGLS